jgi:hypothetical protein
LYVQLVEGSDQARLESGGNQLLSLDQVKTWCGDATRVTIKPVIDLAEQIVSVRYQRSQRLREQVTVRDRTCVFPWCERSARRADLDHIEEFDPTGPPDQTASDNLASC